MKRLIVLALLVILGPASAGFLRGTTAAPTARGRELTGSLENRDESVRASMPPAHPSRVDQVGSPPLVTVQGKMGGAAGDGTTCVCVRH